MSRPANISSASKSPLSFSLYRTSSLSLLSLSFTPLPPSPSSLARSPAISSSYLFTLLPFPPLHRRRTPLYSRSARIRSPKIIRNRFETRPFESRRSWRRRRGVRAAGEEARGGRARRFLLPLLSTPPGTFLYPGRAARGGRFIQLFYNLGSSTRRAAASSFRRRKSHRRWFVVFFFFFSFDQPFLRPQLVD